MMLYFTLALLILVGCESNTNEGSTLKSSENSSTIKSTAEDTIRDKSTSASELGKPDQEDSNDGSSEVNTDSTSSKNLHIKDTKDKETLTQYSSKQIEYARVWLQLGANQQIDELYVKHIPAGTPINPDDHTSASYPKDVIQLAGSRLVDGSVTYSGNGDGTITIYNVPLRWDGNYPAGEKFYTDMIKNTKQVYVDPGNDKEVIALIKLQKK